MINLDSIFKSRDITLLTKIQIVKAMVFPVVMYGCESWTINKTKCQRIDAFELWCWRRLWRVPWTARRSNQFILKEISPEYSLEGLMAEAEAPILWPPDAKNWLIGKILMLGKTGDRRTRGQQRTRLLDGITNPMGMSLSKRQEMVKYRETWHAAVHRVGHSWVIEQWQHASWTESTGGSGMRADQESHLGLSLGSMLGSWMTPDLPVKLFRSLVLCLRNIQNNTQFSHDLPFNLTISNMKAKTEPLVPLVKLHVTCWASQWAKEILAVLVFGGRKGWRKKWL